MDGSREFERGVTLLELGRAPEAEAQFRTALSQTPDDVDLLVGLARALWQQDRVEEATEAVGAALYADPDDLDALLVTSSLCREAGDLDRAQAIAWRVVELAPHWAGAHRHVGSILLAQHILDRAIASLEEARRLEPDASITHSLLGFALYEARRLDDARVASDEALRLDPENADAHRLRGLLELRSGSARRAVDAHRSVLRLDPTETSGREALALSLKARNPLYALLVRMSLALEGRPALRWAPVIATLVASRALRTQTEHLWAQVLLGLLIAAIVLSWALEPLMNLTLAARSTTRVLLTRAERWTTAAFSAYVVVGIAAVVAASISTGDDVDAWLLLALGCLLWSMSAGHAHLAEKRPRASLGVQVVGAVLGLAALALTLAGVVALSGLFIVAGIAALWFVLFS